ncbi:hypothetical protein D3C73_1046370 [compost metagenome]
MLKHEKIVEVIKEEFPGLFEHTEVNVAIVDAPPYDPEVDIDHIPAFGHMQAISDDQGIHYEMNLAWGLHRYYNRIIHTGVNEELASFLKTLNISFDETSLFIFSMLHETGHIKLYQDSVDLTGNGKLARYLGDTGEQLMSLVADRVDESTMDIIYGTFSIHELSADLFAYKHFPMIYEKAHNAIQLL